MAKLVCVANNKGGVGKTTVSVALAEAIAHTRRGPVLVVDVDPQINASVVLTGSISADQAPWNIDRTILDYLKSAAQPRGTAVNPAAFVSNVSYPVASADPLRQVRYIAGSPDLIGFERRMLASHNGPLAAVQSWMLTQVDHLVGSLRPNFAVILVDCPPGFSLLTEAFLTRADKLLVPVVPTALSTMGLQAYSRYLEGACGMQQMPSWGILKTMVKQTNDTLLWNTQIDQLQGQHYVFQNMIPHGAGWAEAMHREDGHEPFDRTYRQQAEVLASVVNEFIAWL